MIEQSSPIHTHFHSYREEKNLQSDVRGVGVSEPCFHSLKDYRTATFFSAQLLMWNCLILASI